MVEQDGEGLAVTVRTHCGEKSLIVARSRRPVFLPVRAIISLQPGNLIHDTFSPWSARSYPLRGAERHEQRFVHAVQYRDSDGVGLCSPSRFAACLQVAARYCVVCAIAAPADFVPSSADMG
jgi:hypothetical protein